MRALVIGAGFTGRAAAAAIAREGGTAVLASRTPVAVPNGGPGQVRWIPLDVMDAQACRRAADATEPDAVLLVHGPSDVTWCERFPEEAAAAHEAGALNAVRAAQSARIVLVSTDNVFDGSDALNDEQAPPRPANAYGRAKLRAENALLDHAADAAVLRVSLIYGWEPETAHKWLNYFASCAYRLRRAEPVEAPVDLWNTPVLVDDVGRLAAAVLAAPSPPVLHLGGPDRIARSSWAELIARACGADPALVRPVPRAAGRYASRPANSCLTSRILPSLPATRGIAVRGVSEGAAYLFGTG